ncbi:hypothetical protein SAMN06297251_108101 [Fulvimarina manganoxydans]|uniref:Uncharacterized protein n=1 Tax=Fulvimarina manganoxydans TaxID=937218 RepID=A0A1W2C2P7_9HYPH|nr:hypothetical protein [Fulvimarina manganoxydans]SMC79172.1 hypothetical protein SAMN06297251_108101 [Fulvimarina manganoxydans]
MDDNRKRQDPEVEEVNELADYERRRRASKGASPRQSRSVTSWIIAVVVLTAAALVIWAVLGS